jgi:hypothetical protein
LDAGEDFRAGVMTEEGLSDLIRGEGAVSAEEGGEGFHFGAFATDGAVEGGEVGEEEGH